MVFRPASRTVFFSVLGAVVFFFIIALAASETENQDLQRDVHNLKEQVDRLNLQIEDLYFMTEPLRVRIADKQGGNFYYTKVYISADDYYWGMLPSQVPSAELHSLLNSADLLGYSKDKIKRLSDQLLMMLKSPHFVTYEPEYTFYKSEVTYHPDIKGYIER